MIFGKGGVFPVTFGGAVVGPEKLSTTRVFGEFKNFVVSVNVAIPYCDKTEVVPPLSSTLLIRALIPRYLRGSQNLIDWFFVACGQFTLSI